MGAAERVLPPNSEVVAAIKSAKPMSDGVDDDELEDASIAGKSLPHPLAVPALEAWVASLAVNSLLFASSDPSAAFALSGACLACVGKSASQTNSTFTPPVLSPLIARLYRFRSLCADRAGDSEKKTVRSELVAAHRLACLSRASDVQATLLNLILRDLLDSKLVEQAKQLSQNTAFPETASNNQLCRYLYYMGKIQALQVRSAATSEDRVTGPTTLNTLRHPPLSPCSAPPHPASWSTPTPSLS